MSTSDTDGAKVNPVSYRYGERLPAGSALLEQLLNQAELGQLFEAFWNLTHIPLGIIDLDGNVLYSSHWHDICTQFHRANQETCRLCVESDKAISKQLDEGGKEKVVHRCPQGLTDCFAPIILEGKHVADVFVGQFLTEQPDRERFRSQAERYGFDINKYLSALDEIPVISTEKSELVLGFLSRMTRVIATMGMDRKRAMEAESRQSIILDTIPQAIFWKDTEGRYLGCNASFAQVAGLAQPADVIGKTDFDLPWPPEDTEAYRADDAAVLRSRVPRLHIEESILRTDGLRMLIDTSKVPLIDPTNHVYGVLGVYEDVSERRTARQALERAERAYREIFEQAPEGIFQVRLDRKTGTAHLVSINPSGAQIIGYASPEEAIIRYRVEDLWFDLQEHAAYVRHLETEGEVQGMEVRSKRADGSPFWVSITARKVGDEDGRASLYQGFCEDIDERKRLQAEAAAQLRELRILGAMNTALLCAETENQLLAEYCRILVEIGGYRMSWVGFAEDGPEKRVTPVAWAGSEDGFLSTVKITWDEGPYAQGPTGRAIRSGAIEVAQDFSASPEMAPFVSEAVKHGYLSCIAVPFQTSGNRMASLTSYGATPDEWDNSERRLMDQVASALGFGVRTLRDKIAKDRYQQDLQRSLEQTIQVIASTVEQRDPYTAGHQRRVADLCVHLARKMGLENGRIRGLHLAASIHDVGKIGIPAEILSKPGRLTVMQYGLIKEHAQLGYDLVKNVSFPWPIAEMILQHHEHLDGSGYPRGLKGDAILLESRILTIADFVEALSSHRPYRPALGVDVAFEEILRQRGVWYDPDVTDACILIFREDGYSFPE